MTGKIGKWNRASFGYSIDFLLIMGAFMATTYGTRWQMMGATVGVLGIWIDVVWPPGGAVRHDTTHPLAGHGVSNRGCKNPRPSGSNASCPATRHTTAADRWLNSVFKLQYAREQR